MIYAYHDDFLVNSLDADEMEKIESLAAHEVDIVLGVVDSFFREMLIRSRFCMMASQHQIETPGFEERYRNCKSEYDHYLDLAKQADALGKAEGSDADAIADSGFVSSVSIGRG